MLLNTGTRVFRRTAIRRQLAYQLVLLRELIKINIKVKLVANNYTSARASLLVRTDVELLAWSVPQQASRCLCSADCRYARGRVHGGQRG